MSGQKRLLVPEANYHRNLWTPGSATVDGVPEVRTFSLVEAGVAVVYFEATVAGTLDFAWLRPDLVNVYDTLPVAQVAISANTEAQVIIPTHGEGAVRVTWTPGDDGTVAYGDVAARGGGYTEPAP